MTSELLHQIRLHGAIPRHIAIIMDGNGRWARGKGLPRSAGHRQGMTAVREVIEGAVDAGIEILTLFAFSTENWQRPRVEISALMGLLTVYARQERAELVRQGVEVHVSGTWIAWMRAPGELWTPSWTAREVVAGCVST